MQLTIDISNKTQVAEAAKLLNSWIANPATNTNDALENGHIKPVAKKPKKEAEETFDLDAAVSDDVPAIEEIEDFGLEEEKPAKKKVEAPKKKAPTQSEVIKAFQVYAGAKSRVEAAKVLTKFKVKSVKDLKESDYEKVLKLLAV
jgi:hypothetical protein